MLFLQIRKLRLTKSHFRGLATLTLVMSQEGALAPDDCSVPPAQKPSTKPNHLLDSGCALANGWIAWHLRHCHYIDERGEQCFLLKNDLKSLILPAASWTPLLKLTSIPLMGYNIHAYSHKLLFLRSSSKENFMRLLFISSISSPPPGYQVRLHSKWREHLMLVLGLIMGTLMRGGGGSLGGFVNWQSSDRSKHFSLWLFFLAPDNCFRPSLGSPSLDMLPIHVAFGLTRQLMKTLVCYAGDHKERSP